MIDRTAAQKFYRSKEWKKTRNYIKTTRILCERCRSHHRLEVHHKRKLRENPEYFYSLDPENLVLLCRDCHFLESEKEIIESGGHVVITGSPGSGKTTKAMAIRQADDLVFDYDLLARTMNPAWLAYPRPDDVNALLQGWLQSLVASVVARQIKRRVIIIVTSISTAKRLAERLGGGLLVMRQHPSAGDENDAPLLG